MMLKHLASLLIVSAGTLGTTGCTLVEGKSEYGCKGMPNSMACISVRDVYDLTDGDDYQEQINDASEKQLSGKPVELKRRSNVSASGYNEVAVGSRYVPVPASAANPQPIRTPSVIMRVLIDPYESTDGDLNVPGYVYTEIEPRRWEVGARNTATSTAVIRPMTSFSANTTSAEAIEQNNSNTIRK
ncbi:type IV conjugative transfer system lipoprotein TraV [Photorhabdus bodei]|uniref:Type IV conjugative transfer system lipoprotein TraV n=1 Tax=Photorhabdus bodei TaxID=2029681 RepID=A0AAW6BMQ2_9GAMM|nr:type IV conjugative transfer system lipoprotein TraV [Photorhabdus bodei]MDB6373953.1 type IV conjugative transfer system lipoprotein TraV [Photorhabdus bodei]